VIVSYLKLVGAIMNEIKSNTRKTVNDTIKKLVVIVEVSRMSVYEALLLRWYMSLAERDATRLTQKKAYAANSIRKFHSIFSEWWLVAIYDSNLCEFDEEAFLNLYSGIIHMPDSSAAKSRGSLFRIR